jgi:cell division protein FtsZ
MIKIKVIGVGGAGVNTVNRLMHKGLQGISLLAVNTDSQSLKNSNVNEKLRIGEKLTKGYGSGGSLEIGRMAANESRQDLAKAMMGVDLVFIVAGLGGGTGGGAGPVIAGLAKEAGALVIAMVTTPFQFEGEKRMSNAKEGLALLENGADTTIVIPNNRLFDLTSEISLQDAFEKADSILIKAIRSITDLATMPGLINLDFSNLRAVVNKAGRGFFGFGEASGDNRINMVVQETFSSALLQDAEVKAATSCLVNIYGPEGLSYKEVNLIMEAVSKRISLRGNIVFGVTIDQTLKDGLRMTLIATGIKEGALALNQEKDIKNWPDTFDYTEELDIPSFLRKKNVE